MWAIGMINGQQKPSEPSGDSGSRSSQRQQVRILLWPPTRKIDYESERRIDTENQGSH